MNEIKEEKYHRDCEEHDAEHCDINEHHNLDPELDDCGHTVLEGPGVGVPAYDGEEGVVEAGFKPDSANDDQDPQHGPGIE